MSYTAGFEKRRFSVVVGVEGIRTVRKKSNRELKVKEEFSFMGAGSI